MEQQMSIAFSVWIDESKKIIYVKENPNGKEILFMDRNTGIKIVTALSSNGYKIV